jgi:hypothetical protein
MVGFACLFAGLILSAASATPKQPPPPMSCLWEWTGNPFGWVKQGDGCMGKCSPPAVPGTVLNQLAVTPCNPGPTSSCGGCGPTP